MANGPAFTRQRIVLGGVGLLLLFGAWLFASDILEARRSLSWPNTPGTVVRSEIALAYKSATMYDALVRYSYAINGSAFESSRISISNRYRGGQQWAKNVIERDYPLGARVTVYYDPADPGRAVLKPGQLARGAYVLPWAMLALSGVCLLGSALVR